MDNPCASLTQRRSGVRAPLRPLKCPHQWGIYLYSAPYMAVNRCEVDFNG